MKIFVQTQRLILREIIPEDIDGLFTLDSDPEVHRYLGNKPIQHKDEIKEVINFIRQQYIENGIGRWAIIDKSTNDFIGWTGLKLVRESLNNHPFYFDLGYRLIRKYWGKGIATESAEASLEYGFNILRLNEIYAAVDIKNSASNKILTKLGFQFMETFIYEEAEHNRYIIHSNDWMLKKKR